MSFYYFEFTREFAVDIGSTFEFLLEHKVKTTDAPIDLMGATLSGSLRLKKDDVDPLLALPEVEDDMTTGLYIPDRTDGKIYLQISDTTSNTIPEDTYFYEITITEASGKQFIFLEGKIEFSGGFPQ